MTLRRGLRKPRRLSTRRRPRSTAWLAACCSLHVERRADGEAALVERLGAVLGLEILADFFEEVRRDAAFAGRIAGDDDRLVLGGVRGLAR